MQRDQKFILGIGIDNVSFNEAIQEIISLIQNFPKRQKAHYVAPINANLINSSVCWNWSNIKNNELLNLLRHSSLALCDKNPLYWLSYLLGSPLKERITNSSFILPLIQALAIQNLSIFLLGSSETETQEVANLLSASIPQLKIVGTAAPKITTEGPLLEFEPKRDALLLEQINNAQPDLLLISLEDPKQALWFDRVSSDLQVPVSIGVEEGFAHIHESLPPAPEWMQKSGIEWLYKLYQEPKKRWHHYVFGIPKTLYMATPAILYQRLCSLVYKLIYKNIEPTLDYLRSRLYLASTRSIAVLELPSLLKNTYGEIYSDLVEQVFTHDHIVVDFSRVRHITLEGISFLVGLWMRAHDMDKELSGLGLSGDMRLLLKVNRAWDWLNAHQHDTVKDLFTTLQQARYNSLYDTIHQDSKSVHISFFGQLDNGQDYERLFARFEPILKERYCIIDLTYCTTIEGRGFSFLLQLKSFIEQHDRSLRLCCLSDEVREEVKAAQLDTVFEYLPCRP